MFTSFNPVKLLYNGSKRRKSPKLYTKIWVTMQQLRTGQRRQRRWGHGSRARPAYGGRSNCFPPSRAGATVSTHVTPLCCRRSVETPERSRAVGVGEANTLARLHSDAGWFVFLILPSKIFHDNLKKHKDYGEPDSTGDTSVCCSLHLPVLLSIPQAACMTFPTGKVPGPSSTQTRARLSINHNKRGRKASDRLRKKTDPGNHQTGVS